MSERLQFTGFPMPAEYNNFSNAFQMLEEHPTPTSGNGELIVQLPHAPKYTDIESLRATLAYGPEYSLEHLEGAWYLIKGQQSQILSLDGVYPPNSISFHTHPRGGRPEPSTTDAITAIVQHPSITWGILSEAGLTLYKHTDTYKYERTPEGMIAWAEYLHSYVDTQSQDISGHGSIVDRHSRLMRERLRMDISTIPWGDEARSCWEALTSYTQRQLFTLP